MYSHCCLSNAVRSKTSDSNALFLLVEQEWREIWNLDFWLVEQEWREIQIFKKSKQRIGNTFFGIATYLAFQGLKCLKSW